MARLDAAGVAARLKDDNRTVVGSKDPDGTGFYAASAVGPEGHAYGLANASTATAAAYEANLADEEAIEVTVLAGGGAGQGVLDKNYLRTQWLRDASTPYDATLPAFGAKLCFVNIKGQPLDASGVPTTVAAAVDADTTALSSRGEAVTNYAQVYKNDGTRTPVPGTYTTSANSGSQYAPYPGWTVQHDL